MKCIVFAKFLDQEYHSCTNNKGKQINSKNSMKSLGKLNGESMNGALNPGQPRINKWWESQILICIFLRQI